MTRETRHLKISNVPSDLTESKLLDYFSNYGRVQKVERLGDPGSNCAVVSFIDIRTAAKAMASEHQVGGREVKASYYEPGATGTSGAVIQIHDNSESLNSAASRLSSIGKQQAAGSSSSKGHDSRRRSHHCSREDRDRSSSSSSSFQKSLRPSSSSSSRLPLRVHHRFHHHTRGTFIGRISSRSWRGRPGPSWNGDQRRKGNSYQHEGFGVTSSGSSLRRSHSSNNNSSSVKRSGSLNSSRQNSWDVSSHQPRSRNFRQNVSERRRRRSGSSGSSNPSKSPSHRSSKSSVSPSPSVSSRGSKNKPVGSVNRAGTTSSVGSSGEKSVRGVTLASSLFNEGDLELRRELTESPTSGDVDPSARVGLIVKNLSVRSTDSSVKDGLFYTYKKLGKVLSVKVTGAGGERYGIVTFKKGLVDVAKAIETTNNEMFLGSQIRVEAAAPELLDIDDNEQKPLQKLVDEHHPRSSRTLYVGNLDPRVTENLLKDRFGQFGFIVDVDIKNRDTPAPYAFVQYADISSVIKAIQESEHKNEGLPESKRVKVGFGKTLPTNIVWLDELPDQVEDSYLLRKMKMYGDVTDVLIDHYLHQALVTYQNDVTASDAVKQLKARTRTIGNVYVQVDYGSAQLNDLFIDRMYRSKQLMGKKDGVSIPHHPAPIDQFCPRKNYTNRDYECPTAFTHDGFSNNNDPHFSTNSSSRKNSVGGSRNRSKESSSRGSDTDTLAKDTSTSRLRLQQPPHSPDSHRKSGKQATATAKQEENESARLSSDTRRQKITRRPSADSKRRLAKTREEKRRRKFIGSGSSHSRSTSPDTSSNSEESSTSDGSSSESESSESELSLPKKKGQTVVANENESGTKSPSPVDLENKRHQLLHMLDCLDEKQQKGKKSPSPVELENKRQQLLEMLDCLDEKQQSKGGEAAQAESSTTCTEANSNKPKLGDVFDLGWQRKGTEPVLTGVPPPVPPPADTKRALHRQPSISACSYEEEEHFLESQKSEEEDDVSPGFRKRRPKQFQPRKSSREEENGACDSPVDVIPHKVDVEKPTTSAVAPDGQKSHRDSGFFDATDESSQGKCEEGPKVTHSHESKMGILKSEKKHSLDSSIAKEPSSSTGRRDSWKQHSPISTSVSSSHLYRSHHTTQTIPLEQKSQMKDPRERNGETNPVQTSFPLPNFAADISFRTTHCFGNKETGNGTPAGVGASNRNTDVSSGHSSSGHRDSNEEMTKSNVRRTVSGESSGEDLGGMMTSPEGSLPTPTGTGNEIFSSNMKSPVACNAPGSSPNRPSLEERIRALDAKFSALEQNMQAAKDKPSQSSRAVDISKYVVKRKPSTSGGNSNSSAGSSAPESSTDFTKSLYKSSIFDQDIERLKTIDEKYTPSPAALLTRTLEVKPDAMDILDLVDTNEPLHAGGVVKKHGNSEKEKNKRSSEFVGKQQRHTNNQLTINIPSNSHQQPDSGNPPRPLFPPASSISPGTLISPPPQRGILKKPKTPTSAGPVPLLSSGPVFPPNLSIPPPPLPMPFGGPSGPTTPTDPRTGSKKDSTLKSPSTDTPSVSSQGHGSRLSGSFHGQGFQKSQSSWGSNSRGGPPPYRQQSFPQDQLKSTPTTPHSATTNAPKSAYNLDPRKQGSFVPGQREEKQFGLRHDRPNSEIKQQGIFQIMGVTSENSNKSKKHHKELRNKELDELFRQQCLENEKEARKELPKIKKKEKLVEKRPLTEVKPKETEVKEEKNKEKERIVTAEKKKHLATSDVKDIKLVKEKEKTEQASAKLQKVDKDKEKEKKDKERDKEKDKERDKEKAKPGRPKGSVMKKQEKEGKDKLKKSKQKKRTRHFSTAGSSSEESEDSDSGSSDSDVEVKAQKSFERELQRILEEEEAGGQSMYDRVKRRSSAARGEANSSFIEKQKEYLEQLKKKRDKQKGRQQGRRRVRVSTSSEEEEEESESENEKEQPPPPKKQYPGRKKEIKEKNPIKVSDVFGHGESSDEEEKKEEKKPVEKSVEKKKNKRQREESEKSADESEENEDEPPAKKSKLKVKEKEREKVLTEKRGTEKKGKRGRKPKPLPQVTATKQEETTVEPEKKVKNANKISTEKEETAEENSETSKMKAEIEKKLLKELKRKQKEKMKEKKRRKQLKKLSMENKERTEKESEEGKPNSNSNTTIVTKAAQKQVETPAPTLMTKAMQKAIPSPLKSLQQEEKATASKTTLDTNEEVPSDIVEALQRSSKENAEPDSSDSQPVVLQEYTEEVLLGEGDQVLLVGENGQVEQYEVTTEEATEDQQEQTKNQEAETPIAVKMEPEESTEAETETEAEAETTQQPAEEKMEVCKVEPKVEEEEEKVKEETVEEKPPESAVLPPPTTTTTPPEPCPAPPVVVSEPPPITVCSASESTTTTVTGSISSSTTESTEVTNSSSSFIENGLLAEQRPDPCSHVDEVIEDVVHGYVEIDPEKLIKMTAKQPPKKSPTERINAWDAGNSTAAVTQHQPPGQQSLPSSTATETMPAAVQQVVDASHALIQQRGGVSQASVAQNPLPPPVTAYEQLLLQHQHNFQQQIAAARSSGISPQLSATPTYATPNHAAFPTTSALYPGVTAGTPYPVPLDPQARALFELQQKHSAWGGLLQGAASRLPMEQLEHLQRIQQFQEQQRQQQQQMLAGYTQTPVSQHSTVLPPTSGAQAQTPQTPLTTSQPQVNPQENQQLGGERILHLQKFPVKWQGHLALKTDQALVQMHFVSGNAQLITSSLPPSGGDQSTSLLRISQRMRLEQQQLEGVQRRMLMPTEHCVLLALPCGHSADDIIHYSKVLHEGFITYLQQKQAAGIVNVNVESQVNKKSLTTLIASYP